MIDGQPWIWRAALVTGASYFGAVLMGWDGPAVIMWKGLGVGLLALWAGLHARTTDGWLMTGVMAFGALGDVLLEAVSLTVGAVAFAIGHILAIGLYARNRRTTLSGTQRLLGWVTVPAALVAAWAIARGNPMMPAAVGYTAFVALMAAIAWTSRFPRYRTGIGAMLFLASDLLIFARFGPLQGSIIPALTIWPLYFAGQALICRGVVSTLSTDARGNAP